MKPTKQQRAEVSSYIQKWQPRLYLHEWAFKTTYYHEAEKEDESTAAILMNPQYKQADIKINPKFWDSDPREREMILVHELCHCIVYPLVQLASDACNQQLITGREIDHWKESVTQHLTNAIFYGSK